MQEALRIKKTACKEWCKNGREERKAIHQELKRRAKKAVAKKAEAFDEMYENMETNGYEVSLQHCKAKI